MRPLRVCRDGESSAADTESLSSRLAAYAGQRLGRPVKVAALRRLAGGASCDTWAFDLHEAAAAPRPLVLRRAFEEGILASDLTAEFALLGELHGLGFPVARPFWCEPAGTALGTAFLITERVSGTDLRKALAARGDLAGRQILARELIRLQARLHAIDWRSDVPSVHGRAADIATQFELWVQAFEQGAERVSAAVRLAIAWLRSNMPAAGERCIVHGDFKANNILFSPDGALALLDWEMCHVGDPIEDLAWTMLWQTEADLVGGLLTPQQYLSAYQSESGRTVPAQRLAYWRVFSWVKLSAIFHKGGLRPERPMLTMLARAQPYVDAQLLRELSGRRGDGR